MRIVGDSRTNDNETEADLAADWNPDDDGRWEPDDLDDPISWVPTDMWFDLQAEKYDAMRSDVGNFAAKMFRRIASEFRALDAATVEEFEARSETYPV